MSTPRVYLDECVDIDLAAALQQRGFIVTMARDQGTAGASDEEQIEFATRHGWIILSHNALHFQRWDLQDDGLAAALALFAQSGTSPCRGWE